MTEIERAALLASWIAILTGSLACALWGFWIIRALESQ